MSSKLIDGDHEDVSFCSFPPTYLLFHSPCFQFQFDVVDQFEVQFDVLF